MDESQSSCLHDPLSLTHISSLPSLRSPLLPHSSLLFPFPIFHFDVRTLCISPSVIDSWRPVDKVRVKVKPIGILMGQWGREVGRSAVMETLGDEGRVRWERLDESTESGMNQQSRRVWRNEEERVAKVDIREQDGLTINICGFFWGPVWDVITKCERKDIILA